MRPIGPDSIPKSTESGTNHARCQNASRSCLDDAAPTTTTLLEPVDLRVRGFEALVKALGWVNAVHFIHQFERSRFDYTAERDALLPPWGAEELVKRMVAAAR